MPHTHHLGSNVARRAVKEAKVRRKTRVYRLLTQYSTPSSRELLAIKDITLPRSRKWAESDPSEKAVEELVELKGD